ncbi:ACT domain-containing protein [Kitasatospora sp. DSM 101779]|uniref:ACT domain-containing protein n=1 Tax=Kitasatospora sp. DSM 101779 TaxID=2853165 RepID=UPI0021D9A9A3|nr:ACT domain-containing protein [Kitasatospora sp. DSM 101779]MCU7826530.1 ACT domain-containing protein [Kitasatospora sp. DSM 101779]
MVPAVSQQLRVLPGEFVVEHLGDGAPAPDGEWLALVRAPEGLTVIRPARPDERDRWTAFYGGDTAHAVDVPGMLAALLAPLAADGIPVFVASTFHADVVLVPSERVAAARAALRTAGHIIA